MTNFDARLKRMNEAYQENKQFVNDVFTQVPVGVYIGLLQSAGLKESGNGKLMIQRSHLIIEGDLKGRVVWDHMMIDGNDRGFTFIIRWIKTCGYEAPHNSEGLPEVLNTMSDENPKVKFLVKHSGDYVNVTVQGLVEAGEPSVATKTTTIIPEEEGDAYTAADVKGMTKSDLIALITDYNLDFDCEGKDVIEIQQGIMDELGLGESEVTEDEIKKMKRSDLIDLIEEDDLPIDYDNIRSVVKLRREVLDLKIVRGSFEEDEEQAKLEKLQGKPVIASSGEVANESVDEDFELLKDFCVAQGYTKIFETKQQVIDEIATYFWDESEITEQELELFERNNMGSCITPIEKKAPPERIVKRT